jgi:hypothetical protein
MRIEHRHQLVEIGHQFVTEHQGMGCRIHQLDLRRLHGHLRLRLHANFARLCFDLQQIGPVGIADGNDLCVVIRTGGLASVPS